MENDRVNNIAGEIAKEAHGEYLSQFYFRHILSWKELKLAIFSIPPAHG